MLANLSFCGLSRNTKFTGLLLCVLLIHDVRMHDLYSVPINNADVYSSSTDTDSLPHFVVDEDFYEPNPTCFGWDPALEDTAGFHWILIDFKATLLKIREIRLVTERRDFSSADQHILDSYVVNTMEIPKHWVTTPLPSPKHTLPWDSPGFLHCASITEQRTDRTATFGCLHPLDGRWLAIRTRQTQKICLINVYLENVFKECFEAVQPKHITDYRGSVFRYVRHIPQDECHATCMNSPECEATVYIKHRFSGTCQLVHLLERQTEDESDNQSSESIECPIERCFISENRCHRGLLRKLEPVKHSSQSVHKSETKNFVETPNAFVYEWVVLKEPFDKQMETTYLLSVKLDGTLHCSEWDCGLVYIYSVGMDDRETLCTFLNTRQWLLLSKSPLLCSSTSPPINTNSIRVKWKKTSDGPPPKPQLNVTIVNGYVRLTYKQPNRKLSVVTSSVADSFEKGTFVQTEVSTAQQSTYAASNTDALDIVTISQQSEEYEMGPFDRISTTEDSRNVKNEFTSKIIEVVTAAEARREDDGSTFLSSTLLQLSQTDPALEYPINDQQHQQRTTSFQAKQPIPSADRKLVLVEPGSGRRKALQYRGTSVKLRPISGYESNGNQKCYACLLTMYSVIMSSITIFTKYVA